MFDNIHSAAFNSWIELRKILQVRKIDRTAVDAHKPSDMNTEPALITLMELNDANQSSVIKGEEFPANE